MGEQLMKATPKQVAYAMSLLGKAGYSTRYMNSSFTAIGATMRQRSGTVENWLSNMTKSEISDLISELKDDE